MQIILFCPFDADVLIPYGRYWCSYAYGSHGHVHGDASLVETCASYDAPPIQSEWFGFYSLKRRSLQTYSGSITYFSQILNVKFFLDFFVYPQKRKNNPQRCVFLIPVDKLLTVISQHFSTIHILLLKLSTALYKTVYKSFKSLCYSN